MAETVSGDPNAPPMAGMTSAIQAMVAQNYGPNGPASQPGASGASSGPTQPAGPTGGSVTILLQDPNQLTAVSPLDA